ncbi:hypothetical protein J2W14_003021 [Pseudarthrobacter oxydans]|nr:hypothetical protein [Pseudarthrobacter oxydans]
MDHPAAIDQTIASTYRSASVLKMLSRLTMVSNFEVLTITTWTQATSRIETMVSGHCT